MLNKTIVALGADVKNRLLLAKDDSFTFGTDLGDLSEARNFELFKQEVFKITAGQKLDIIACDLHPGYFSTKFAKEYSLQIKECQLRQIQHHHAHIASVMQEHHLEMPLIGIAFDGIGYGLDGNSWGGEFFLVNKSDFKRVGYFKYRMMPGADKVVAEPWRMASSILGKKAGRFLPGVTKTDQELVVSMMAKNINSPKTSSVGRLFDAAAALLGICAYASFEAEGPIKLEELCDHSVKERYRFNVAQENECFVVDTDNVFLEMFKDLQQGINQRLIASKFHNAIVAVVVEMAKRLTKSFAVKDIALSGGVFQNIFLRTKSVKQMADAGLNVWRNVTTPVNDLNIALGQYYVSCSASKS